MIGGLVEVGDGDFSFVDEPGDVGWEEFAAGIVISRMARLLGKSEHFTKKVDSPGEPAA